ncbi:hypothetical protein GCM10027341_41350 [Spirosoma knui]
MLIGPNCGISITTGYNNAFMGIRAGQNNTTGYSNAFLGANSGRSNTSGSNNAYLGVDVGYFNTTGSNNAFIGYSAGFSNTTGNNNTFVGGQSGLSNTTGLNNAFVGTSAGYSNTTGRNNTYVGDKAGRNNQLGNMNTFLGPQAGFSAQADSNTFVGYQAGYSTTTGQGNTFFGILSGKGNMTGSRNTFVGNQAGPATSYGSDNVYIGYSSGQHDRGSRNTFLGYQTGVALTENAQPLRNATAIGAGASVAVSDAVVLGNKANVGIGTSSPTARLHVESGQPNESGLRLADLTAYSPVTQASDAFLTVDEQGYVRKARYQLKINTVNEWSDNVFSSTYRLAPLDEVAAFIKQKGHLPGVPSAEAVVKEGVDLVKMNATLLEKIEELTLYVIALQKADQQKNQSIDQQNQRIKQLEALITKAPK